MGKSKTFRKTRSKKLNGGGGASSKPQNPETKPKKPSTGAPPPKYKVHGFRDENRPSPLKSQAEKERARKSDSKLGGKRKTKRKTKRNKKTRKTRRK